MLEDDDVGSHEVMGISSYRDKTTSSLLNSMSHTQGAGDGAGTGFFSFPPPPPNGFIDRMSDEQDKMRFHGYESSAVVAAAAYPAAVYDSAGMLSEMFDFGGGGRQSVTTAAPAELLGLVDQQNPHISDIHAGDAAAAAMHLFFTNPPLKSSPPYTSTALISDQGFHTPQFTWIPEGTPAAEGRGLSLSLASSLEAAKAEELRLRTTVGGGGGGGYGGTTNSSHEMMFFNAAQESRAAAAAASSSSNSYQQLHFGFGTTSSSVFLLAAVNVLRNSKYTRPAQELLEEFCSVGRGNHNKKTGGGGTNSGGGGGGGSSTKDPSPLSPADRMEHQRRKVKLATMLDEVERRYSHYCEQMQMVVNSFEMVMGFGAAVPYTALAQKAMSRHFRCLKDGIQAQLKQCCEVLGEKDLAGGMGITKGETPRLKMLEQNLRKQRVFHQMGIMEQEAWRPQRGLPERSVNILRAWLFEHFLHPYPSDADKHLLARQTGLSRNQVANWFINARVRLWKPMIEDMYQQESKERDADDDEHDDDGEESIRRSAQTPMQITPNSSSSTSAPTTTTTTTLAINDNDPSLISSESAQFTHHVPNYMLRHHQPTADTSMGPTSNAHFTTTTTSFSHVEEACSSHFGTSGDSGAHHHHHDNVGVGPTMIRFGGTKLPATGDVSLTLGLRQGAAVAGRNPPDKTGFSFTDFGRSS